MVDNERQKTDWLKDVYGSRRGLIRTCQHRLCQLSGKYSRYRSVDLAKVERLVFVCKGNICRSAFAEVVARSMGMDAVSCGLDTVEGAMANKDAIRTAKEMDFDLDDHRTVPFESLALRDGDLFVAMEPWQADKLEKLLLKDNYCTLLGLWGRSQQPYIHDPYGSSSAYFRNCFHNIQTSVDGLVKKIKK